MALNGSLKDFGLEELVGMLSLGKKSGRLNLKTIDKEGDIYFRDGLPVHAVTSSSIGVEAFYSFFLWSDGNFVFDTNVAAPEETFSLTLDRIIKEAAEHKKVWEEIKSKLPDMNVNLEPVEEIEEETITLSKEDWEVLVQVFRRNTVKTIVSFSKTGTINTINNILSLMDRNYLKISEKTVKDISKEVIVELRQEGILSTTPTGEVAFIDPQMIQEWQKEGYLTSGSPKVELITPSQKTTIIPVKGRVGLKEGVIQLPATVLARLNIRPGDKIRVKPEV